jgi:hypothetical protein
LDNERLVVLSKQVIEAKTIDTFYSPFEELSKIYFQDNKYSEFTDFLRSLESKNKLAEPFINYYIALTRYNQLKYLEEKQSWDEYFSQGNSYRDEITSLAKNAIDKTKAIDPVNVYARLLIWKFHNDQKDAFVEESLTELMNAVSEYGKSAKDLKPIKDVADQFAVNEEKGKSKELYRLYAQKLASSDMKEDELLKAATDFYKEGNLDLSETFYDTYIAKISKTLPKEKLILVLTDIAKSFAYKDYGLNDMSYAEKMFERIEELSGKEGLEQELMYLRAFNLEKAKEFREAKDIYLDLVKNFPQTSHNQEAIFKAGMIYAYILSDIKSARLYFEELVNKEKNLSPQAISSLYQLGLLAHWEGDSLKAKEYYDKIMIIPSAEAWDTQALVRERLKEIEEAKPIEYNLRTFMDVSLKGENSSYNMGKTELRASVYKLKKGQDEVFSSTAALPDSGCMQVEIQYLWSGHTGSAKPSSPQSSFQTTYSSAGTKEINLVVVSPTGIFDRNIDFVDVD